jgi:hypothetical protein
VLIVAVPFAVKDTDMFKECRGKHKAEQGQNPELHIFPMQSMIKAQEKEKQRKQFGCQPGYRVTSDH